MDTAHGYLSISELTKLAPGVTGTEDEKKALIDRAETLVDSYLGIWQHAVREIRGLAAAATENTIQLSPEDRQQANGVNMLVGCVIDIIGGTAAGEQGYIKSQTLDGIITVQTNWGTQPDTTSYYRIYQGGKVPRKGTNDLTNDTVGGVNTYFRVIPRALKQAVAAQVEYVQQMGIEYFTGGDSAMQSESMDGYSYNRGDGGSGKTLVAPSVRSLLSGSGLVNRAGGQIIVANTII